MIPLYVNSGGTLARKLILVALQTQMRTPTICTIAAFVGFYWAGESRGRVGGVEGWWGVEGVCWVLLGGVE